MTTDPPDIGSLDFWVDLRLGRSSGRWLSVADMAGDPEIGYGATPRDAIAIALAPLGWAGEALLDTDLEAQAPD